MADERQNPQEAGAAAENPTTPPEPPVSDADEAAEASAAAALAEGEVEAERPQAVEVDPAARAREIAEKWLPTIPEQDRELASPKQVKIALYALKGASPKSHLTWTKDKFGNPPAGVLEAINRNDLATVAVLAREFATETIQTAAKTDKVKNVALSDLPKSVQTALLNIILVEGPKSAQQAFAELANRLERGTEGTVRDIVRSVMDDKNFVSEDADNIRREALKIFLDGTYPDFTSRNDVRLVHKIASLTYEEKNSPENVETIAAEAAGIMGEYTFNKFYQRYLGGAQNASELLKKIKEKSIGEDVLGLLGEILEEFITADATKGK